MIESISCVGYRGFSTKQTLNLAIPNGTPGSGLTVLVGPNGGGKSTLIECFNKIATKKKATFSKGKRNIKAGNRVEIVIKIDGLYNLERDTRRVCENISEYLHPNQSPKAAIACEEN